jgi:hypothetical protein
MIIWLASYPRSGNTYMRVVLKNIFGLNTHSIHDDVLDIAADENTAEVVGHEELPEDFDFDAARESKKLYLIKTHLGPANDSDKAIYLVRDGRESTLSYMNYLKDYGSQTQSLMDVIFGQTIFGGWGEHVRLWDPKNRDNTLIVKFEDFVEDSGALTRKLSKFIGCKVVGDEIPTFDELHKTNPRFFRSGRKDSWKKIYTKDEHNAFWLKNFEQMQLFGYDYEVPSMFQKGKYPALFRLLSIENNYLSRIATDAEKCRVEQQLIRQLDQRQTLIEQQQELINDLYGRLSERQQISDHRQQISDQRQKDYDSLNELASQRKQKLDLLQGEFNVAKYHIETKDEKIEALNATLTRKNKELSEQKCLISEKTATIDNKNNAIEEQKKSLKAIENQYSELRETLDQKLNELHKLKGEALATEKVAYEKKLEREALKNKVNELQTEIDEIKKTKLYQFGESFLSPAAKRKMATSDE